MTVAIGEGAQPAGAARRKESVRLRHGGGEQGGGLSEGPRRAGPTRPCGRARGTRRCRRSRSGGSHRPHDAGSRVCERGRHALEGAEPQRRVPDHALAPGDGGPARLELRLDQEDEVGARGRHRAGQRGHDAAQRNELQVGHDQRAGLVGGVGRRSVRQGEGPHVGVLQDRHLGVGAQGRVELPVADVDRVDVGRATLEQAVGEAAGRCTRIEGAPVR